MTKKIQNEIDELESRLDDLGEEYQIVREELAGIEWEQEEVDNKILKLKAELK